MIDIGLNILGYLAIFGIIYCSIYPYIMPYVIKFLTYFKRDKK